MKPVNLRKSFILFVFVSVLTLLLFGQAGAADPSGVSSPPAVLLDKPVVILYADPDTPVEPRFDPPPANFFAMQQSASGEASAQASVFQIVYLPSPQAWPEEARAAFDYAAQIWSSQLTSSIPIQITASWTDLSSYGSNVLGGAGPVGFIVNPTNAPVLNTAYPLGLANKLAVRDYQPGAADIQAALNSAFPRWYFGLDGNPGVDRYDFVSVVLHEIAHGLGFFNTFDIRSGMGVWGIDFGGTTYPAIFDRYVTNGLGQSLLQQDLFPYNSTQLAGQLVSGDVYFNGQASKSANAAFGYSPVKLYAPATWSVGSSISHLDEIFNNDVQNRLMTFSVPTNEADHNPGPVTLAILQDMGWTVIGEVSPPTPVPTPISTPVSTPVTPPTPGFSLGLPLILGDR